MNVLSLFDGMSCGRIALERAGIKVNKYFASEIKKAAIQVTQENYPDTIQLGDIRKIDPTNLPKIDLLIGGSPCQDFSLANSKGRQGLKGKKSSLFFEFLRLLKATKPKYFLLENVRMKEDQEKAISKMLGVNPIEIDSKLVSAQTRKRLYWTNIGKELHNFFGVEKYIPQPKDKKIMLADILEEGYLGKEKANALAAASSKCSNVNSNPARTIRRFFRFGTVQVIFRNKETFLKIKEANKKGFALIKDGEAFDMQFPKSKTRRGRKMQLKTNCLKPQSKFYVFKEGDIRYFTQTELERLQTVPEGYTSSVSYRRALNLLGDGWTVDVIAHIFQFLK